jgi:hypothetical protein
MGQAAVAQVDPYRPGGHDGTWLAWGAAPIEIADAGLLSSAARSALRAARGVTVAPAIRWVARTSGRGPDVVGMVTAMCCCSPVWR